MRKALLSCVAVAGITAVLSSAPADAQQATGTSDSAGNASAQQAGDSSAETVGLGDIIVTAQRRAENLQRAALAVTAVDGDTLARADVTDATKLTRVAPALQIGSVFGPTNTFFVRGVGNFVTNSLSDPAVSFNVDGVNIARPTSVSGVFYDLERVEVLKGPQGTLYGRNATGGSINVITTKPKLGELGGYINGQYGNFDAIKVTGAVNAPLGANAAIRVAGQLSQHDGYYSDGTGDERQRNVRATFLGELSDTFKITIGADYSHQGGIGPGSTVNGLNKDDRIGLFDPRAQAIFTSAYSGRVGSTLNNVIRDTFMDNSFWGVYAQADLDTSLGTLTVIPSYREGTLDYKTYASSFAIREEGKNEQVSLETRLVSDDSKRLSYILGLYYQHTRDRENVNFNQMYFSAYGNFAPVTDSYAAFGRLNFKVTDRFRLTGAARYTIDDKTAPINTVNALVICPPALPPTLLIGFCQGRAPSLPSSLTAPSFLFAPNGSVIPFQPYGTGPGLFVATDAANIQPSKVFRKLTYRVGAEFDVAERSLLYAAYETGYKSGGFFQSIDNTTFQPETITAITIGSKNRFLDNRLQLNVEAFRWTYKNQQFSHLKSNSLGGTEFITENIGKTRIQGVEVEAAAQITRNTMLNATIQYLDAVNKSFVYTAPDTAGPPVTGCPITGHSGGLFTVDCSGFRPQQSPKWTINLSASQTIPLGDSGNVVINVGTRYQSGAMQGADLLPQEYQRGYFMSDAEVTYSAPGDRFTIGAFVNNIEDKNVAGFSGPHPQASSLFIYSLRPPRTYGVRAGMKF